MPKRTQLVSHSSYPLAIKNPHFDTVRYFWSDGDRDTNYRMSTPPSFPVRAGTVKALLKKGGQYVAYDVSHGFDGELLTLRYEDRDCLDHIKFKPSQLNLTDLQEQ